MESVWDGRSPLTESLDRDYADMLGDGWDLIWEPTSPLTTPWWQQAAFAQPDPDQHVKTALARRGTQRKAPRILRDWSREYTGAISQQGSRR